MFFISQTFVSESVEKINALKDKVFNDRMKNAIVIRESNSEAPKNHEEDNRTLLKDGPHAIAHEGENVLRDTLGNPKGNASGNVSSPANLFGIKSGCIPKPDDCGRTDILESHKAVIQQGVDELHSYSIQIEEEREKYRNTVSEISVLKSEVARLTDALHNNRERVVGLNSSNENAADDLNDTIKELRRQNTLSAEKIARLEQDKCLSESSLNETIDRIKSELDILKTELKNTKLELNCTQVILSNRNADKKILFDKNQSLTHELYDLQTLLENLTNEYLPSAEQERNDSKESLEDELDRSTEEQKDQPQRTENEEENAAADIVVIAKSLNKLKRQNTSLDLQIEKTLGPSDQTFEKTESCPSDSHLVTEQYARDTSYCSASPLGTTTATLIERSELKTTGCCSDDAGHCSMTSCAIKDQRINELQSKLDELEKAYANKALRYQEIIGKLEMKVRMEKKHWKQVYKSDIKLKDNHIDDIVEGFRIYTKTKNVEIERERNNVKYVTKELKDQRTLLKQLKLEETNALYEKFDTERVKVAKLACRIDVLKTRPMVNVRPPAACAKFARYKPPGAGKKLAVSKPPAAGKKIAQVQPPVAGNKPVNHKPSAVVKKLAASPKPAGPCGDDQQESPAISPPVVGSISKNAPEKSKSETSDSDASSSLGSNKSNTGPDKLVKKTPGLHFDRSSVIEIFYQKQRERDKRIDDLRKKYRQRKAFGITSDLAQKAPPPKHWKY